MMTEDSTVENARRARILDGAMRVFLAYGYRRTTMDDIAGAAEISRPALYLVFRNKSAIYRALARNVVGQVLAAAEAAIAEDLPLEEKLGRALRCALDVTDELAQSPHGAEILDMKNSLAGDIMAEARERMAGLVGGVLAGEAARRGGDGAQADLLTQMLLDSLDGLRERKLPQERQHELTAAYIRTIAAAIGR